MKYLLLLLCILIACADPSDQTVEASTETSTDIRHSFFVAGPNFTGIIGEDDEVLRDTGKPGARDGYVLPNGNMLIAWSDHVQEININNQVVFEYKLDPSNAELGTAVRLEDGLTMITELGDNPRIIEVDNSGSIQNEVALEPETDNAHMQTRMARKLDNGNYLVPHLLAFAVKEYQADGTVVKTFETDLDELGGRPEKNWPFTAIRLDNGNTLVNLTNGNKTVEFNSEGEVVWKVSNDDFDTDPFDDPCGAQRLANGNTVIASYHREEGVKLFEITREKEIVWTYEGPNRVHHFQILTSNGSQLTGPLLK